MPDSMKQIDQMLDHLDKWTQKQVLPDQQQQFIDHAIKLWVGDPELIERLGWSEVFSLFLRDAIKGDTR